MRDLIADHDLAQISVSDITKRAGVNRSTFYEHYTDVHDLAASACAGMFDELVAATPMFDLHDAENTELAENPLAALLRHVAAQAELYRTLLGPDGSARLINHLLHRIVVAAYANRSASEPHLGTHASDPDDVPHDPESAVMAGAVLGVVIDWVRRGCPGTPDELADAAWPRLVAAASVTGLPGPPPPQARRRKGG